VSAKRDLEDRALFREATRGVKQLVHDRHVSSEPRPAPRARFTRADRRAILEESLAPSPEDPALAGGEEISFARPGVQSGVLRKLRRGQYRVQGELDLHGLTVAEAKSALRGFLARALAQHARCVRIIHGKGLRSGPRGPVLKQAVGGVLRRVDAVLAVVSARDVDGGTGAVYVLLSPQRAPTSRP
jgi:DNA-nicking Smr family endonuclease